MFVSTLFRTLFILPETMESRVCGEEARENGIWKVTVMFRGLVNKPGSPQVTSHTENQSGKTRQEGQEVSSFLFLQNPPELGRL